MKRMLVLGIILIALLASVGAVSASTVTLVQKQEGTWVQVNPGTVGTFTYTYLGSSFSFSGQGLSPGVAYSLISYQEPWNGAGLGILGAGTADGSGNIVITGSSLAIVLNTYSSGEYIGQTGAKIWLVPSSDLTTISGVTSFNAWNPTTYLFETALINPGEIPVPEFPTVALPAALIIGLLGAVLFIQKSKR
jgi:hypothetical protein